MPQIPTASELRSTADALLSKSTAPGATEAVLLDGEPLLHSGFGSRDLGGDKPVDVDAPFLLYSVTKTLLAIAAMRLVELGALALGTAVTDLLPEVPLSSRITLRQLLSHTSGLPDYGGMATYHEPVRQHPDAPWTDDVFLDHALQLGSLFAPGEGWAYSNIGYMLVRQIVEGKAGGSLAVALDDLVFRPLGLEGSSVAKTCDDTLDLAPGFTDVIGNGTLTDMRGRYHPGWVAHGVVRSTARELASIVDALFAGQLVGPGSLTAMCRAVPVPVNHQVIRAPGYGLGLMIDRDPDSGGLAGHAGGGPGYSTAAFSLQGIGGQRVTSVALVNRDAGEAAMRISIKLAKSVAGRS